MKKELIIGIIASIGVLIFAFVLLQRYDRQNSVIGQSPTPIAINTNENNSITLTNEEISKHNNAQDCWLIINKKIYAATNYIPKHPGGKNSIIPFCGKDATRAFQTRGGKGAHPLSAQDILTQIYIGDLGGQTTVEKIQSAYNQNF